MITKINDYSTGPFKRLIGNENDTPPNDVGNGSEFYDMTNKKTKLFDAESQTWDEQPGAGPSVDVQALNVTENGTYTAPEGKAYSPVTVDVPQGGGGVPENDVNFYDYDGTVVASYSAADFASLSAMPANPDHTADGLTAQGWNWSLAEAKAYVADYGMLDVGQMYVTTDGKTRIKIHLEAPRLSPRLNFGVKGTATVEWGDGTTDTLTGSNASTQQYKVHTYASGGDYTIAIGAGENDTINFNGSVLNATGSYNLASDTIYMAAVTGVYIGKHVKQLNDRAFYLCRNMAYITMHDGVTYLGQYLFYVCGTKHITVPHGITSLGQYFATNSSVESVSLPNTLTNTGQWAFQTSAIRRIAVPSSATRINGYSFYGVNYLKRATIPNTITNIDEAAFSNAQGLQEIKIPNSVASIGNQAFVYCKSAGFLEIGTISASIPSSAFSNCDGLGYIKFSSQTPPTVSSSNAFQNLPTDCKILVPTGTKATYEAATNYPNPATYTYVEY